MAAPADLALRARRRRPVPSASRRLSPTARFRRSFMDAGFPIPLPARLKAFYSRSFIRTQWWEAEWRQRAAPPRLAVIGCYDTGNVGDLALGWTLRAILRGN